MSSDYVKSSHHTSYQTITLNRPLKYNALTLDMYQAMTAALQEAQTDTSVQFVVLRGEGNHFCAGNDLAAFAQADLDLTPVLQFLHTFHQFTKPVIAVVQGQAVGIGTTVLMHCDYVLATPLANFQLPFAKLGLCPEFGASYLLPKIVGKQKATEWLMLGEPFDATEAQQSGLVNQIVETQALASSLDQIIQRFSMIPGQSLQSTKKLLNAVEHTQLTQVIDQEAAVFAKLLQSETTQQIIASFFKDKTHA